MLGRVSGFGVPIVVFMDGALEGKDSLLELAVGEDSEEVERTDNLLCGW